MATLEKLVRTVEALKLHQTPSISFDETMTKKEKISHCASVTDVLCNQGTKNSPESAKYLAMAMDMYFTLLDDQDSDMRMVADENLNRVIRTLGETNVTRIQVELYKEIKKNGSSRCVRAALWRFSYLAPHIRPAKSRAYLVNLMPCLDALVKRTEESIHETLAYSLPLLFKVLGNFANDNEIKALMKSLFTNICCVSAVLRRTAAQNLVVLATNSRKPVVFTSWLLNTACNMLLPLGSDIPSNTVIGVLTVCRQTLPHFQGSDDSSQFLRLYEICIFFLTKKDHNIVNASLETLQCLLRVESKLFIYLLNTPAGLMSSSIIETPQDPNSPAKDLSLQNITKPSDFSLPLASIPTDFSLQSISEFAENTVDPVLVLSEGAPSGSIDLNPVDVNETPPGVTISPVVEDKPVFKKEEDEEDLNIGSFTGEGVSIQYLARLLVSRFLLTRDKGTLVPDSSVRVSVKTLALSCMCEVLLLNPQTWNLHVSLEDFEEFSSVTVSDLAQYLDHEDPGLRGSTARLLSILLRGACIESGGSPSQWFEGSVQNSDEISHMLISSLKDSSSLTIKQALSGIKLLIPQLLEADLVSSTSRLLETVLALSNNSYWLIKMELCDLLSKIDPLSASYILPDWSTKTMSVLTSLLADEDARVRQRAASSLAKLSKNIFHDRGNIAYEKTKLIYQEMACTNDAGNPVHHSPELPKPQITFSSSGFQVILEIYGLLKTAGNKHLLFGCIEALDKLIQLYPPGEYPGVWGIHMPRLTRASVIKEATVQSPASSLLNHILFLLESSIYCTDLVVHSTLLRIAAGLYSGLVCHNLRETGEVSRDGINSLVLGDTALSRCGDELLQHLVKLLSISQHVLEDIQPVQTSSKPSLPSLQNTALSPIKKKQNPDQVPGSTSPTPGEKPSKDEKKLRGYFFGNPFYMKMFEILKSSFNIYKTSLDEKSEEKVSGYVVSVLNCFSDVMNYSIGFEVGKHVEEYLLYMKACMVIAPRPAMISVQALLRCLFKHNFPFSYNSSIPSFPRIQTCPSIFEVIISSPYTSFTIEHGLNLEARDLSSSSGSSSASHRMSIVRNHPFRPIRSAADKNSLASFIRLFEPMVIKALKHYTVSCDIYTQIEVLKLLIQLVRLRVNYCLLDSDQIFTGFVLKQLENIEENQLNNAENIIPVIFEFLTLLSYESYHSKVIIDVPKILQLCEGLSAGDQRSAAYTVAALQVVATDLFTTRSSTGDGELDTQREVIISMLLRYISHPTVISTIASILTWIRVEAGGEEKSRKLSRQILDVLLPQLCGHQVELSHQNHVVGLLKLLKSLCPGSLRPCDAVVSSLLSCSVDLNNLTEIHSWLAFTITSLVIIFQLSPEEAILGRLQELGIMLGSGTGSSILDSSMESSCSSSDPLRQGPGSPPEYTLVTFLFHCVGAATSKLHHMVFSTIPQDKPGQRFLEWELKEILLIVMYILQSGNCSRIAKAGIHLAKNCPPGALHNIDLITDMILQLSNSNPTIVTQWLYIMILLDRSPIPIWAKALNSGTGVSNSIIAGTETSEPSSVLNLEIVRRSSLAVVSNQLIENTHDGELLAWFLSSQIREIVQYANEPQIHELLSVIHRQAPSSGLFLESISARWDIMKSSHFMKCTLDCLANTHKAHTGRVLNLLVNKYLVHPSLALSKRANVEACKRVDILLQESEVFVLEQLPQSELSKILELLSKKKLLVRFARLIGLLNRLSVSFYELSPVDFGDGRKFHPGSISNVELDNTWFLNQVKRYCCSISQPKECAKLLSNLGFGDIMLVLTAKDFNIRILDECLVQGITLPDGRAPSMDSLDRLPGLLSDPDRSPGLREVGYQMKEGPPLYRAASQVLLQHIKNLVELLPRPSQVYRPQNWWQVSGQESRYSHKLDDFFSRTDGRNLLIQLLPAFSKLLLTYPRLPGRRPTLPPHAVLEMARFGILALELVKWILVGKREDLPGKEHILDSCLQVASLTFSNPHLTSALSLPAHNALVSSAVLSITDYILVSVPGFTLPEYPYNKISDLIILPSPPSILVSGTCLAKLLMVYEKNQNNLNLSEDVFTIIVGLSRLSQFSSLTRAPPLAFSLGWTPELGLDQGIHISSIPAYLLQEKEVLHQLVWRLNTLGWSSRAQFEETWMSLLSVLNVSNDDLSNEEISALSQSTALVVNALSSLLVTTLALPVAGIPGAQLLHHPRDTPNPFLLSGRGQQLTAIQNIIHQRLDDAAIRIGLPVDSSVNLERAYSLTGEHRTSYSPVPRTRYGAGQVSLSYMSTCMAYHEEGSDDRQSITSSALPLFLLIREENLAAAGLDTNSCIHFIIDLFSQWLAFGGQDTPLTVLTAAVRSIIMVSDIFTQSNQFNWMLSTLSELQKVHPGEDEIMSSNLCLGLCKAVAVLGTSDSELMERLKKSIESCLRSQYIFARTAALHGSLYLLQSDLGGELQPILGIVTEHIKGFLLVGRTELGVDENTLVMWSTLFFILENFSSEIQDTELENNLTQLCLATSSQADLPRPLYTCLLTGLERLVVAGRIKGRQLDQLVKIATDLMTEWAPVSVIPAVQLFLAAMYASHPPSSEYSVQPTPLTDPEQLMQMMEQMSILFDCVRRAGPHQAELLSEILPQVLIDFFPASDVVNRVISEFISPGQPHPALLAGVLRQIFRAAGSQNQQSMLTEWVLVSLPNFTRRSPLSHSIWCLSCFFLAASTNPCLQAMFPHLLYRTTSTETLNSTSHEDRRLFCLAGADFYFLLTDKRQKDKFIQTFKSAAEPGNPYSELLATVETRQEN